MKIAQIVCVYPPYKSGLSTSAVDTARLLKAGGQAVETITLDYGRGALAEENVTRLKGVWRFGNGGFIPQLAWRLKDFDCIYLHYPFFGAAEIIWFLKKFVWKKKKKLVIHYHMDAVLASPLVKILGAPATLIFRSLFQQADLIISASLDYARHGALADFYRKNPDKFAEIPFGVDVEKFKPKFFHLETGQKNLKRGEKSESSRTADPSPGAQAGKSKAEQSGAFKILFVGGLDRAHDFKGLPVLLAAVAELKKEKADIVLDIVGSGDRQKDYAAKAVELGIAGKVNFLGPVSPADLPGKYQDADVFVLPSINQGEAFGIVLLEALASGLPVIASALPGVRKVFTDGREGLLAKPGDAADLKDKIEFFLDNPEKRREMGRKARLLALEKYDAEKAGARLNEEIRKL